MITTENIKLEIQLPTNSKTIEQKLNAMGIEPLRWAIIAVENSILTINVSYEKIEK